MKNTIILFLFLIATSLQAQIKLEHSYSFEIKNYDPTLNFQQVDSTSWKYIFFPGRDSIFVYNINHSLEKTILLPTQGVPQYYDVYSKFNLIWIGKGLFTNEDKYTYMISPNFYFGKIFVFDEDGNELFGCESCEFSKLINTGQGPKMIINYSVPDSVGNYRINQFAVFSLPGKLPTGGTARSGVSNSSIANSGDPFPTSSYPNPSNGQIHIDYKLPNGVSSGEIVITNDLGNKIRKFKVGSMFHDIVLQSSDLESGTYFYKVITDKGASEAKKIVVVK